MEGKLSIRASPPAEIASRKIAVKETEPALRTTKTAVQRM